MSIRPIGNRILIKALKAEERTSGGIILTPSSSKSSPNISEVIALGKGDKIEGIKIGDHVIHSEYSGTKVKDNNEEYTIIEFENILGIID